MSRIRAKDTAVELIVRRELFSRGLRYRTHVKDLPGTPDIAIKKQMQKDDTLNIYRQRQEFTPKSVKRKEKKANKLRKSRENSG